jgi:hypothetical protein
LKGERIISNVLVTRKMLMLKKWLRLLSRERWRKFELILKE